MIAGRGYAAFVLLRPRSRRGIRAAALSGRLGRVARALVIAVFVGLAVVLGTVIGTWDPTQRGPADAPPPPAVPSRGQHRPGPRVWLVEGSQSPTTWLRPSSAIL